MSAPALRDLQQLFFRALRGDVPSGLRHVVQSTAVLPADRRLGIYADMFFWRLRGVLAADFERLAAVLGDEAFTAAARDYLGTHPSEHPSVRHFGRHFPAYLHAHLPAGAPPWTSDLAALEWARVEVFDAADAIPVRPADFGTVAPEDWPELRFSVIPAMRVVESAWPIHRAWEAPADRIEAEPTTVRVWRQDHVVCHCAVDASEREAMRRLLAGDPFGDICNAFADLPPEDAGAAAGALLARWIEDGLIGGFTPPV
ncbi:MAG TPA: DNA-binding domain-containing protein [Candidatus Binatia bacterium]|jgi:hypothetical protein|nr:DNA-binding domain-containing protein [Candidatus Binatia bacterium]